MSISPLDPEFEIGCNDDLLSDESSSSEDEDAAKCQQATKEWF